MRLPVAPGPIEKKPWLFFLCEMVSETTQACGVLASTHSRHEGIKAWQSPVESPRLHRGHLLTYWPSSEQQGSPFENDPAACLRLWISNCRFPVLPEGSPTSCAPPRRPSVPCRASTSCWMSCVCWFLMLHTPFFQQDIYGLYEPRYRSYDSAAPAYADSYRYPEPERPSSRASHCSDRPSAR